jgi:hypothetical protein
MLEDHWEVLSNWKDQFTPHADVLLYGCEIAKGEAGVEFVRSLAVLTGLDVAASDNLTGSWRKGGDWLLEIKSGRIESQLAVSKKIIDQYPAVLRSSDWDVLNTKVSDRHKQSVEVCFFLFVRLIIPKYVVARFVSPSGWYCS